MSICRMVVASSDYPADSAVPPRLHRVGASPPTAQRHRPVGRHDVSPYRDVGRRVTELAIRQSGSPAAPRLIVTATPSLRTLTDRRQVRSIVERLLGLHIDLSEWYRLAHRDRRLAELADRFRGLKPPRFPTVFEALVNAFACQQLSLVVGLELLNRLAAVCDVRSEPARRPITHFQRRAMWREGGRPASRHRVQSPEGSRAAGARSAEWTAGANRP